MIKHAMYNLLVTDSRIAAKKMSAMDSLVVLEKEFATLRDRYDSYYSTSCRIALC